MNYLIEYFSKQKIFNDLLTVFIVIIGIASIFLIRREVFPNVTFDIITITTISPGTSAEEIEKLITNKIEQALREVDGIKKLQSTSIESRSLIVAQLDPDQTNERDAKSDIQDVIDRIDDLPESAEDPIVTSIESKLTPIVEVAVAGNMDELELRSIAKEIEEEIERVAGVARVVPIGLRDLEIQIEASPQKLSRFRLSLDNLIQAIRGQNVSIPGGVIDVNPLIPSSRETLVRTTGEFESTEDVENTVIRANDLGQSIRVKDVATVQYGLAKSSILNKTNGIPSINLTILKKEKADAVEVVDDIKFLMSNLKSRYNDKVQISYINDLSEFIRRRLSILSTNLVVGLALVLLILTLILPLRAALIVSMGIPLAFFGAMIYFYQFGHTINLISLLGLIIVIGMLVDVAVVVTDNAYRKMEEGLSPELAAVQGTQQIWSSLTGSVFTTIFAFLPMLFMSGIFGKFVKEIPIGVIIPLLISLFAGFFILPSHIARWVTYKKPAPSQSKNKLVNVLSKSRLFWDEVILPKYLKILSVILRRRYLTAFIVLCIFISSLLLATFGMRFILFPPDSVEVFLVKAEAESGSSLEQTMKKLKPIEKALVQLPSNELDNFVTTVGLIEQDPNDPNSQRGSQYGMIKVFLTPDTARDRSAAEIIYWLRNEVGNIEGFKRLTYDRVNPGPPVGRPISVGVRGREYEDILPAIESLKAFIEKIDYVSDVVDSYVPGKDEIRIILNPTETAAAGLNVATVGMTVRAAYEGIIATSLQKLDEAVDLRVSLSPEDRTSKESLEKLLIPNPMGALIPLRQISRLEDTVSIASIEHEANRRQVKVTADIDADRTSSTIVNNIIRDQIPQLKELHPSVDFYFGGEDEDTKESMESLFRAFAVAILGIFFILILIFQNIFQPFLVVLTIPLGLVAVIVAFFVHGLPLSFMGMLGIVALAGVIVNNAIVFVDFVNQSRKRGLDNTQSILESAKMRLRPIFLTTLTTVVGVMPTAYGIGGLDKFVVPIALSIGWGLVFGSLLTIFVFPAAIAILDDFQDLMSDLKNKFKFKD